MNINAIKNKIQHYKMLLVNAFDKMGGTMKADEDKAVDQSSEESFPASDAPGHRSHSKEDQQQLH